MQRLILIFTLAAAAASTACVPAELVRLAQNAEQAALMAAVDAELAEGRVDALRAQLIEELAAVRSDQRRQDADLDAAVAGLEERLARMFEEHQRK